MTKREANARGDGDRLREQLVAAASELLLAPQPLAAPSLRAVARACSVSPAAVYLHFASQQDLIRAVVAAQLDALRADLPRLDDPALPLRERLEEYAVRYAEWGVAHPGAYQLIFESADRLGLDDHDDRPGWDMIDAVAAALDGDPDAGAAAALQATRLWVALHGLTSLRIHKPGSIWTTGLAEDARAIVALHLAAAGVERA
ncbi:TetR/AcrR family transcriptional regulator [Leifsonia shinshuensis]